MSDAVRRGLSAGSAQRRYRTPSRNMGLRPGLDIDRALALAAADEDAQTLGKLALRQRGADRPHTV